MIYIIWHFNGLQVLFIFHYLAIIWVVEEEYMFSLILINWLFHNSELVKIWEEITFIQVTVPDVCFKKKSF